MRIAILHTRYSRSGGVEKYIHAIVTRLLEDGHEVHCFVRRWEREEHPRLHFHRVPALPLGEGVKALSFAYASWRLLRRGGFDVIHGFTRAFTQDIYTDGSGCFEEYLAYLRTAPRWRRIFTFRPLLALASRHIERRRFRAARKPLVLAMSGRVRDQIIAHHAFPLGRIEVLHCGVDTRAFHPGSRRLHRAEVRARLSTEEDALAVLFVGNDYRRKGLAGAMEAVARLGRRDIVLWVLGRDRRRAAYEHAAERLGIRALFIGARSDPAPYLAAADIFLFPSLYDAFGNAALEAMASGLPCIVSSRAGVSEVVSHGEDALVLGDPGSPGEIAAHLAALRDPGLRGTLGASARKTAEGLDFEIHFQRLMEVYRQVASDRAGACGHFLAGQGDAGRADP